jgi:hypothetical protein
MSKNRNCIVFKNIHQLWSFAQKVRSNSIEIITSEKILVCDCSEDDLAIVAQYGGEIKEMKAGVSRTSNL